MPDSARDAILASIRAANGTAAPVHGRRSDWEQIPREYLRQGKLSHAEILDLFEHRLTEYDAHVFRIDAPAIAATIRQTLTDRTKSRMLIPAGISKDWLPADFTFQEDTALSYESLDRFDGALTTATVAIAATGSIVLQHGPGQGRRALSLIPDYHLCIVAADQIVETVSQAFDRLDPVRPTTFISGPSATADIEMTRIKGVHGPRFLDVIVTR
jgi:L-lactate dehydrogenase complex protein LldG